MANRIKETMVEWFDVRAFTSLSIEAEQTAIFIEVYSIKTKQIKKMNDN